MGARNRPFGRPLTEDEAAKVIRFPDTGWDAGTMDEAFHPRRRALQRNAPPLEDGDGKSEMMIVALIILFVVFLAGFVAGAAVMRWWL